MSKADPLFTYLAVLSVIQPARIQDIEKHALELINQDLAQRMLDKKQFRHAHEKAQELELVIPVRRGVYFLTPKGKQVVRRSGLEHSIDNRRLFLMKSQRRRYK
ncbi:hypothetical protein [Thalassospira sp.]|uniref:hypothetical protein n=1 Tax=Thalassospira sp. TaxID=1912094 RepID=UPI00311DFF63